MICFIINYNRLTLPSKMADYLAGCNVKVVIVDNNSDYPPLLEYYETTPHEVMRLDNNLGNVAVWYCGALDKYGVTPDQRYVITDPDLNIDHVPKDWPSVLNEGLDKYDFAWKAGFSLRISDLPNSPIGNMARKQEAGHWSNLLGDGRFYRAYIDTTFCLCRARMHDFAAVRAAPPYDAIHVPWYYTSLDSIPEDEIHYIRSQKSRGSTFWTEKIANELGVK